jgi:hypothetical protein
MSREVDNKYSGKSQQGDQNITTRWKCMHKTTDKQETNVYFRPYCSNDVLRDNSHCKLESKPYN